MKKFLSLLMMSLLCISAWAETVTLAYSGSTTTNMTGNNDAALLGLDATAWSVVGAKGGNNTLPGLNKAGDIRLYYAAGGGNTLTVTSLSGATINSITIAYTEDAYSNAYVQVNGENVTATNGAYAIGNSSFVIGNANTSNVQVRITSIVIDYGEGTAPAQVAAPVIYFDPLHPYEGEQTTCTITCETEGANILYALNDGEYQEYTEPFTLTETTTVKAKAQLENATSDEVTKTVTFDPTVANIAALTQLTNGTYFKMAGEAVVAYVNGRYLYIKDDTGYTLVYNSTVDGIAAGNTISNLKGKVSIYNGLFEVANATYEFEATEIAVEPTEMAMTAITADNMNQYVVIKGVTLSDVDGRNIKLNDADGNQLPGYSQYFCDFPEDLEPTYDVEGFVAMFNQTVQLYPTKFTEAVIPEPVITVTPDFGEYEGAQTVFVTVENMPENAAVFYNFVEAEPAQGAPRKAEGDIIWNEYDATKGILVEKSGLLTIAINDATGLEITSIEGEYTITNDVTAVENVNAGKAVASVRYYNAAGQQATNAFQGVNIVVTTYNDGTQSVSKVVR